MNAVREPSGDLGPNQIKWLRANIRPFDLAWRQVKAADANAAKVAKELGIDESAEISPPSPAATRQ